MALAPVGGALAAEEGEAPEGSAEAVVAEVGGIVEISKTAAKATGTVDTSEASATVIGVGGKPLSKEFGGSQKGKGSSSGGLYDSGDRKEGRIQVTPWSATVEDDGTTRTSTARSAVLRVFINGVVSASVLQSESTAQHSGGQSSGSAFSDAADVTLFNSLRLVLLHSEASSAGEGSASAKLAQVNDTAIGSSDQVNTCAVAVPGVVSVNCLQAAGGKASVATGSAVDRVGFNVIGAASDGDNAATAAQVAGETIERGDSGALPATGSDAQRWMATGIALVALGYATSRVATTRRPRLTA